MNDELSSLFARLKAGAARAGEVLDRARFAADADYAKTAILRFTDFSSRSDVAQALRVLDRLAAADATPAARTVYRCELRPVATTR